MDKSKRRFIKVAPLAALAGTATTVAGKEAQVVPLDEKKRYVLKLPDYLSREEFDGIQRILLEKGFPDVLVIAGPMEIYELT